MPLMCVWFRISKAKQWRTPLLECGQSLRWIRTLTDRLSTQTYYSQTLKLPVFTFCLSRLPKDKISRFNSFDFSRRPDKLPEKRSIFGLKKRPSKLYQTSSERSTSTLMYLMSVVILTVGAAYAAVPLYRIFCQASGYGGTTREGHNDVDLENMNVKKERLITIKFNADTAASLKWNFRPQQPTVQVYPGETALAFYTARNPTDKPIDGISTYNVVPFEAGPYFNKIQCFCFEEQRLNPNEEVDMPVFFYIDPEYLEDPFLEDVDTICLSYTFFESKPGLKLPGYHPAFSPLTPLGDTNRRLEKNGGEGR